MKRLKVDYALELGIRKVWTDQHGDCVKSEVVAIEAFYWQTSYKKIYQKWVGLLQSIARLLKLFS